MTNVYLLHHVRVRGDGEDVKLIGVYGSEASTDAAIARLSDKPGFRDYPDGFHVEPYTLDMDHWVEGFVTLLDRDAETANSAETAHLARLWSFAQEVWGDEDQARAFMFRLHPLLEDRRPIDVAMADDAGAQRVEDVLGGLAAGSAA